MIWVVAVREEKNGDRRSEKNNIVEDDTPRRRDGAAKRRNRRAEGFDGCGRRCNVFLRMCFLPLLIFQSQPLDTALPPIVHR